jgi:hypothetical protein
MYQQTQPQVSGLMLSPGGKANKQTQDFYKRSATNPYRPVPPPKSPKENNSNNTLSGQSTVRPPKYIDYNTTEDAAQNALAQGQAGSDLRYLTKSLNRPGFSQGKGQEYLGSVKSAEQMNKSAGAAADIRSQDQLANNRMKSAYEKATEQEAQNYAMAQHGYNQADWAKAFAKSNFDATNQMAYLQSMLQLQLALLR